MRQSYIFSNIVLDDEPLEESIKVYKNGVAISRDDNNGWSYDGHGTAYAITGILDPSGQIQPFQANQKEGYIVRLNGSAKLNGADSPSIEFERK
jgi:hypothetical protein